MFEIIFLKKLFTDVGFLNDTTPVIIFNTPITIIISVVNFFGVLAAWKTKVFRPTALGIARVFNSTPLIIFNTPSSYTISENRFTSFTTTVTFTGSPTLFLYFIIYKHYYFLLVNLCLYF